MRQLIRSAKLLYVRIFNALAHRMLRRKKRHARGGQAANSIKLVCRYGLQGGLTNGALYNGRALASLGYKADLIDVTSAIKNPFKKISCEPGGCFVFHCAAPQFLQLAWPLRRVLGGGKIIGYFAWELTEPPADWPDYKDIWDEIWTPSNFSAESLGKLYDCPIRVVPHVLLDTATPRVWNKGGEPLTFLAMADARSSLARKNPRAAVAAFRKAFADERDVALVIKLQVNRPSKEVDRLHAEIGNDPRIRVIQETLSRAEVNRLFTDAHVFVSLHRAEGFGLPLLEARLFGLATIGTAWSGNMDFMGAEDSCLIPHKLAAMWDEGGVYGNVTWADPDVDAAAAAMRRFYDDPAYLDTIAQAGWAASQPEKQLARFSEALKGI